MIKRYSLILIGIAAIAFSGCQAKQTSLPVDATDPAVSQSTARPMEGKDSFDVKICKEVPKDTIATLIDNPIESTEDKSADDGASCTYYTNKKALEYLLIKVNYASAATQRQGQETLQREVITNSSIPMNHFIAIQADGQINAIYLVMAENKYVRIDRTARTIDNDQLIAVAIKVASIIIGK